MDFTGRTLLNRGERVGLVTGMEPIPGNLCLYVRKDAGSQSGMTEKGQSGMTEKGQSSSNSRHSGLDPESLVPLHPDLILSADPDTRTLDLDLPDGLI